MLSPTTLSPDRPGPDHRARPPPLHAVVEAARLAALNTYAAVDVPRSAEFDALAQKAAQCMDAQAGLVVLVDKDRLWIRGAYGVAMQSAPRLGSFCNVAVTGTDPVLLVPDATGEPRFQTLPWVAGPPHLRFYAGAVLEDSDGYRLGTVCAMDQAPGEARPAAVRELSAIAAEVTASLAQGRDVLDGLAPEPRTPSTVQGWLGVRTDPARGGRPGLLVVKVAQDSPARRAGVRSTDVLLAIDGQPLWHSADVSAALAQRIPGGTAWLRLRRLGTELDVPIAIEPDRRRT